VRATTAQYYLIRMLQSVGLDWDDIQPVAMTVPMARRLSRAARLMPGRSMAFPSSAPSRHRARVLSTAKGFLSGNYASPRQRRDRRSGARRLVRHLQDRAEPRLGPAHQDEWRRWWQGDRRAHRLCPRPVPSAAPISTLQPVTDAAIASQQAVADVFAQAADPRKVDVRPLWDTSFNSVIAKGA
jgi:sulfonate transport system substrate-binding protein